MKNKTILVVDDTITNLDILIKLLSDYDVIDTTSGLDALDIVKEEKVDLILLDIMMPEIDGFEVCKKLKENPHTKDIPVIFITALSEEDSIEKAYSIGGIDYITKPFKPKELLARVKIQLEIKELQQKELQYYKQIALSELIHNISHHWRQPLSVISTVASGIKVKSEYKILEDAEVSESMDTITLQTQYLSNTIDDFRDLVKNKNQKEQISIVEVSKKAISILQSTLLNNNIEIITNFKEDFHIEGYANQFIQALINIINNSYEAIESKLEKIDQRFIFIDTEKLENGDFLLRIKDNAMGIQEDIIHKIFDPYVTTKHQSVGTGVGLSMTYQIIQKYHNGTIKASNINYSFEDKNYTGACFDLIF